MAERVPVPDGLKETWKVVEPAAVTVPEGAALILKSAAFVPLKVGVLTANEEVPLFSMVNVLTTDPEQTTWFPKSGLSVADGLTSPSAILVLLLCTSISGSTPVP